MAWLYTNNDNFTSDDIQEFEGEMIAISQLFNEQATQVKVYLFTRKQLLDSFLGDLLSYLVLI